MRKFFGLVLFLLFCRGAQANGCILDVTIDGTNATGIDCLEISAGPNMGFYDISFESVTLDPNEPFPSDPGDIFWLTMDETGANDAVEALNAALVGVTTVGTPPALPLGNFVVPYQFFDSVGQANCDATAGDSMCMYRGQFFISGWVNGGQQSGSETGTFTFARFAPPAPVPLPPAVWLFGSGLAMMLGWMRRKKTVVV